MTPTNRRPIPRDELLALLLAGVVIGLYGGRAIDQSAEAASHEDATLPGVAYETAAPIDIEPAGLATVSTHAPSAEAGPAYQNGSVGAEEGAAPPRRGQGARSTAPADQNEPNDAGRSTDMVQGGRSRLPEPPPPEARQVAAARGRTEPPPAAQYSEIRNGPSAGRRPELPGVQPAHVLPDLPVVRSDHQEPRPAGLARQPLGSGSRAPLPPVREDLESAAGRVARLLDAIRLVESGDDCFAIGDNGRSRGAWQISKAFWTDSGGNPADWPEATADDARCRAVILAYWKRYCPTALAAGDCETLARVQNGGPRGASKRATVDYWRRVAAVMEP